MGDNFDLFDDFESDSFGNNNSHGFDNFNNDIHGGSDDFDVFNDNMNNNVSGSFDDFNNGFDNEGSDESNPFSGQFDTQDSNESTSIKNQFTESNNPIESLGKKSYIIIGVGVGVLILFIIIASVISKASRKKNNEQAVEYSTEVSSEPKGNANDIMNTGNNVQPTPIIVQETVQETKVVNNVKESDTVWTEITKDEKVSFNENPTKMTFTITGITHKARAVDASETLVVKTTLTGTISGLPGTYEIDVPYNKGILLEQKGIGTFFDVNVILGEYNGRTVVGDISY